MVVEIIVIAVVAIIVLFVLLTYNRLITLRMRIDNAFAQIDVFLKKRYDLVPNLVETVKGYAKHEKELLENVTKARAGLMKGSMEDRAKSDNMLTQALKSLFAVSESYPQLKANENFLDLQKQLQAIEGELAQVRIAYNDNVLEFNTATQVFPSNLIANMLGFAQRQFFTTAEAERATPKVKFT